MLEKKSIASKTLSIHRWKISSKFSTQCERTVTPIGWHFSVPQIQVQCWRGRGGKIWKKKHNFSWTPCTWASFCGKLFAAERPADLRHSNKRKYIWSLSRLRIKSFYVYLCRHTYNMVLHRNVFELVQMPSMAENEKNGTNKLILFRASNAICTFFF